MNDSKPLQPRLLRLRDAPRYLGLDRYAFNQFVRPHLAELRLGARRVLFDRLDLDRWVEQYKTCSGRSKPIQEKKVWGERTKSAALRSVGHYGTSTKSSVDDEFTKALAQAISAKRSDT